MGHGISTGPRITPASRVTPANNPMMWHPPVPARHLNLPGLAIGQPIPLPGYHPPLPGPMPISTVAGGLPGLPGYNPPIGSNPVLNNPLPGPMPTDPLSGPISIPGGSMFAPGMFAPGGNINGSVTGGAPGMFAPGGNINGQLPGGPVFAPGGNINGQLPGGAPGMYQTYQPGMFTPGGDSMPGPIMFPAMSGANNLIDPQTGQPIGTPGNGMLPGVNKSFNV